MKDKNYKLTGLSASSIFLIFLILSFIFRVLVQSIKNLILQKAGEVSPVFPYISAILLGCVFIGSIYLYKLFSNTEPLKGLYKTGLNAKQFLGTICVIIGTIGTFLPISLIIVALIAKSGYNMDYASGNDYLNTNQIGYMLLGLFVARIVVPFCEETMFRGILGRGYRQYSPTFGLLLSSFIFAIMHGSLPQFPYQFILGIMACILYYVTKSIWPSILLHAISNGSLVIFSYVQSINENVKAFVSSYKFYYLFLLVIPALILLIYGYIYIVNQSLTINNFNAKKYSVKEFLKSFSKHNEARKFNEVVNLINNDDCVSDGELSTAKQKFVFKNMGSTDIWTLIAVLFLPTINWLYTLVAGYIK